MTTTRDAVLELVGLGKDYGARIAVHAIDLSLSRGEIFGLLGPNGAGKTTTISMACGVVAPSRGTVRIAGAAAGRSPAAGHRDRCGLAGAVGPEQAEDLAARQRQIDGVDRDAGAIVLAQSDELQDRVAGGGHASLHGAVSCAGGTGTSARRLATLAPGFAVM